MKTIKFNEFLSGDYKENKTVSHFKKNKKIYQTAGLVTVVLILIPDTSFASTGIDTKAKELYFGKLLVFGKWAIVLKGGWDTINKALKEDFEGAKKVLFSYLTVYAILWALPWGLDQVESVFTL